VDAAKGYTIAAQIINEHSEMSGVRIKRLSRDSATDVDEGVKATEELQSKGVRLFLGPLASPVASAVLDLTVPNGDFLFSPFATAPELTAMDNEGLFMRSGVSQKLRNRKLAEAIVDDGNKTIVFVANSIVARNGMQEQLEADLEDICGKGCSVLGSDIHDANAGVGDVDYAEIARRMMKLEPDAVVIHTTAPQLVEFYKAFDAEGYEGIYWGSSLLSRDPEAIDLIGNDVTARVRWTAAVPYEGKHQRAFQEIFEERTGQAPAGGDTPNPFDAMLGLGLALQLAGPGATPKEVADAMREIANPPGKEYGPATYAEAVEAIRAGEDINFHGGGGPFDFDETGDVTSESAVFTFVGGKAQEL